MSDVISDNLQKAQAYFEPFRRTCERSQRLWPVSLTLKPVEIDSDDFAHGAPRRSDLSLLE
jgi:hypothetical protein